MHISKTFEALGTQIEIDIIIGDGSEPQARRDINQARQMVEDFTRICSRFDPLSELSCCNAHINTFLAASAELREVASKALAFFHETDGVFDPRIIDALEAIGYDHDFNKGDFAVSDSYPSNSMRVKNLNQDITINGNMISFGARMDFSGLAKGYITDKVAQFLKAKGWKDFLVDCGGDMFVSGHDDCGKPWLIDIEHVSHEKIMFGLSEKGIATSGISRRKWEIDGKKFHHLINPKNPKHFSFDLKTVTVVADNAERADVWAKTLFLLGKQQGIKFANEKKIAAVFLDYRGSAWISKEAKKMV